MNSGAYHDQLLPLMQGIKVGLLFVLVDSKGSRLHRLRR